MHFNGLVFCTHVFGFRRMSMLWELYGNAVTGYPHIDYLTGYAYTTLNVWLIWYFMKGKVPF